MDFGFYGNNGRIKWEGALCKAKNKIVAFDCNKPGKTGSLCWDFIIWAWQGVLRTPAHRARPAYRQHVGAREFIFMELYPIQVLCRGPVPGCKISEKTTVSIFWLNKQQSFYTFVLVSCFFENERPNKY